MRKFTFAEMRQAAEREWEIRRRVYPNRVDTGRMTRLHADRQLALMRAIADYLRDLEKAEMLL